MAAFPSMLVVTSLVSAREDVIIETVVPAADVRQTGQGGGVRLMVGGAAAEFRPAVDSPRHQFVRIGAALRPIPQVDGRQEQVVVHQERPVIHFDEQVVRAVVVTQVAGDAGSLGHPVHPQAAAGVVNAVIFNEHINGRVEFDASHFRAGELAFGPDVVDLRAWFG